jgi:hypothetical protein
VLTHLSQVREVKQKIAQEKGEYEAERMKVIYSGMSCHGGSSPYKVSGYRCKALSTQSC